MDLLGVDIADGTASSRGRRHQTFFYKYMFGQEPPIDLLKQYPDGITRTILASYYQSKSKRKPQFRPLTGNKFKSECYEANLSAITSTMLVFPSDNVTILEIFRHTKHKNNILDYLFTENRKVRFTNTSCITSRSTNEMNAVVTNIKFLPTEAFVIVMDAINDKEFLEIHFDFLEDMSVNGLIVNVVVTIVAINVIAKGQVEIVIRDATATSTLLLWHDQISIVRLLNIGEELCIWNPFCDERSLTSTGEPAYEYGRDTLLFVIPLIFAKPQEVMTRSMISKILPTSSNFYISGRLTKLTLHVGIVTLEVEDSSGSRQIVLSDKLRSTAIQLDLGVHILLSAMESTTKGPLTCTKDSYLFNSNRIL